MRRSLVTAVLAAAAVTALAGCGPSDAAAQPAGTHNQASPNAQSARAQSSPSAGGGHAGVTPDQICGMMSVAKATEITGFTIKKAVPSWSADVAVCTYEGESGLGKLITEYQPNAKVMFDMTKASGVPVAGLGQEAVYFKSSGQLSVRLDAVNLFHCYVLDVRIHHNDAKGGAVLVGKAVVPQLPRA